MAAPTTHTEVPAGESKFPPFQSQYFPSQLLWLTVTFALLYVLMSKITLPRIGSIIADRSKRIANDIAAAQCFKEQSEQAHSAYEKALADAHIRAQTIATTERERQSAAAHETSKRLEAQLHEQLTAAEHSIAATRMAALGNIEAIAAATAPAIVQQLIGKSSAVPDISARTVAETGRR
jgi:F-type H+-transporting ATPase subunit b